MKLNYIDQKKSTLQEKERSKSLIEAFNLKTGLVGSKLDKNGNTSLLNTFIDKREISANLNLDKSVYFVKIDNKIIKTEKYQSLKEMNDIFLFNLTEDYLINDMVESYNYYISGGDIRDKDKIIVNEFLNQVYGADSKRIEYEL